MITGVAQSRCESFFRDIYPILLTTLRTNISCWHHETCTARLPLIPPSFTSLCVLHVALGQLNRTTALTCIRHTSFLVPCPAEAVPSI